MLKASKEQREHSEKDRKEIRRLHRLHKIMEQGRQERLQLGKEQEEAKRREPEFWKKTRFNTE